MLKNIHRKYFEVWGDEQSQNSILKGLLTLLTLVLISLIITITILSVKKPFLISIDGSKTKFINSTQKIPKNFIKEEIKQVITKFSNLRHNWSYKNINENLKKSSFLVDPKFRRRFFKSILSNLKMARTKKIIQKFYLSSSIRINLARKQVILTGDRILIVEGLRATQPMTFKINYIFGERTLKNPEGIYISKETLISSLSH